MMLNFLRKITSIKTLVTFWCLGIITYIIVTEKTDFMLIAQLLCSVPLGYLGLNVYQKKILTGNEDVNECSANTKRK